MTSVCHFMVIGVQGHPLPITGATGAVHELLGYTVRVPVTISADLRLGLDLRRMSTRSPREGGLRLVGVGWTQTHGFFHLGSVVCFLVLSSFAEVRGVLSRIRRLCQTLLVCLALSYEVF